MPFPAKTLHDLEWSRLLDHLAARATGEAAARACRALPFLAPDPARTRLALVQELVRCLRADDPPPSLPAVDVSEALALVRGRGTVTGEALRDIAFDLDLFVSIARYLENRRDVCPLNGAALVPEREEISNVGLARLAAEIASSFDPDGALSDTASRELGRLRQRVTSLRKSMLARLSIIAESEGDLLRDATVTLRNDRYVLPVRADAHRRLNGIVHGSSGTGATIYVEPEQIVETGNELLLAREEVLREEARILASLRDAVADQLAEVTLACGAIVEVETRIAAARLACELDAHIPGDAPPGALSLVRARHPLLLLDGIAVVPGTLEARAGGTILISGPNAGGKTVVLKTVGLFGLMLRAGIPVPADPRSRFAMPAAVLTDIGDDQSLETSLSTFSAHMKNIASILELADEWSLVLLDELAAGTDPVEGTALAEAILDALNRMSATTLATTHYDTLKSRAQGSPGFVNAAMGFDVEEGRPTFQMRVGVPGSSSAMAVAMRYGIPRRVLDRARELLPEGAREIARAMEEMERERRRAELERMALAEQRRALEAAQRQHEAELARLRRRQDAVIDKEAEALREAIRRAREKVRDAENAVKRRRVDAASIRTARDAINEVDQRTGPGRELSARTRDDVPGRPAGVDDLAPGTRVHVVSMGKAGVVDSGVRGNTLFVTAGTLRLRVTVDDLNVLEGGKATGRPARQARQDLVMEERRPDPVRTSDNTLDLRGRRADEALEATDAFLDKALREGTDVVFVLHGHGTGALKDAIREYLDGSTYVSEHRPGEREEGGDGITVAWLR